MSDTANEQFQAINDRFFGHVEALAKDLNVPRERVENYMRQAFACGEDYAALWRPLPRPAAVAVVDTKET